MLGEAVTQVSAKTEWGKSGVLGPLFQCIVALTYIPGGGLLTGFRGSRGNLGESGNLLTTDPHLIEKQVLQGCSTS